MHIDAVTPDDKVEIIRLFGLDKKIWPSGVGQNWYWYWREKSTKEAWVKVTDGVSGIIASAHWSVRRDGWRNLKDIIVHPNFRRHHLGQTLIDHIGRPIVLKTDHDSEANGFYRHLGFEPGEEVRSKSGAKLLRVYRLSASPGAGAGAGGS
jgi:GNAT superfamily N-acetyltransferase